MAFRPCAHAWVRSRAAASHYRSTLSGLRVWSCRPISTNDLASGYECRFRDVEAAAQSRGDRLVARVHGRLRSFRNHLIDFFCQTALFVGKPDLLGICIGGWQNPVGLWKNAGWILQNASAWRRQNGWRIRQRGRRINCCRPAGSGINDRRISRGRHVINMQTIPRGIDQRGGQEYEQHPGARGICRISVKPRPLPRYFAMKCNRISIWNGE